MQSAISQSGGPMDLQALAEILAGILAQRQPRYLRRLATRIGGRLILLNVGDITHFYASGKHTVAAASGRELIVPRTLADLERNLDPAHFARIHRNSIVNLNHVRELNSWFSGRMLAKLRDGKTELVVARNRAGELRKQLGLRQ